MSHGRVDREEATDGGRGHDSRWRTTGDRRSRSAGDRAAARGTTFVREVAGPPGAPTLLLLHGWVASGGLNWFQAFEPLARALPGHRARPARPRARPAHPPGVPARRLRRRLRGDARGARTPARSSRSATRWAARSRSCCGAATATSSPGSSSARRRPASCRTGRARLRPRRDARAAERRPRRGAHRVAARACRASVPAPRACPQWTAAEMRRHDWRMIVEAGHSISTYHAGRWIDEVDVPTAVVCTDRGPRRRAGATARHRRGHPRRHHPPRRRRAPRLRRRRASPTPLRRRLPRRRRPHPPTSAASLTPTDLGPPARTLAPRPARGTQPRTHAVQRVGVAQRRA